MISPESYGRPAFRTTSTTTSPRSSCSTVTRTAPTTPTSWTAGSHPCPRPRDRPPLPAATDGWLSYLDDDEIIEKANHAANGEKFRRQFFDSDTGEYGGNASSAGMTL